MKPFHSKNLLLSHPQAKEGKYTLKCNRGAQNGIYCDCEDGWMSSGIHQDDPMTFHWCDTQVVDPSSFSYRPRKLSKVQEVFLIIVSHQCHYNIKDNEVCNVKKIGNGRLGDEAITSVCMGASDSHTMSEIILD